MSIPVSTLGVMVHSRFQFEVNSGIQSNICFSYSLSLSSFLAVFSGAGAQHFFCSSSSSVSIAQRPRKAP